MCKRPLQDSGVSVKKRQRTSSQCFGIENLVFLFFTLGDGYVPCKPEKANAIKKDGTIYKQVGHGFDLTFASLTCLFIRMYKSFKGYSTPTARLNKGRSFVKITDDNGKVFETQALKFASLAWGQVTPAAMLGTAGMPLRDFKRAFQVDHIDNNKTNNNVTNGMIMTKKEHKAKTKPSAEQIVKNAMTKSAPCTMTVFDLEGNPLHDSTGNPVVINYEYRKEVKDDYSLTSNNIADSIAREDTTMNSLVKIKYKGQDCLAQFSWFDVPDLEGEIWKPVTAADHLTLKVPIPPLTEYYVSNLARFKFVVKSTQNAKIRDFRGQKRPRMSLMKQNLLFHRIVALVFHRKQMNAKIAKQKAKFGNDYTFATLEVDHIDFKSTNHCANNLQFLTPEENKQRSHSRPCRIWEIGKKDAKTEYPSVVAAAKAMGYKNTTTVGTILKNNTYKKWRGEYIVE